MVVSVLQLLALLRLLPAWIVPLLPIIEEAEPILEEVITLLVTEYKKNPKSFAKLPVVSQAIADYPDHFSHTD